MMKLRSPRITSYCTLPEAAHSSLRVGPVDLPALAPAPPSPFPSAGWASAVAVVSSGDGAASPAFSSPLPGWGSGASWAVGALAAAGSAGRTGRRGLGRGLGGGASPSTTRFSSGWTTVGRGSGVRRALRGGSTLASSAGRRQAGPSSTARCTAAEIAMATRRLRSRLRVPAIGVGDQASTGGTVQPPGCARSPCTSTRPSVRVRRPSTNQRTAWG